MTDHLKIIQDYEAFIERTPPLPTRIEDTSVLPHPKAAILEALICEIEQGHPKHVDVRLRFGAISLAQYQRGVGREPLEVLATDVRDLPPKLAKEKHLAELLTKMQDRFKKFDELVQDDLRLINSKIAAIDEQKKIRKHPTSNDLEPTPLSDFILILHCRLLAIGVVVGKISTYFLVAVLFAAPLFAAIFGSWFAAVMLSELIGGGIFVSSLLLFAFLGFLGFYVAPNVRPHLNRAMGILLEETEEFVEV
jgi:hypothetical protein